jgi:unsaturated chondroitin disaccharide hydrolase
MRHYALQTMIFVTFSASTASAATPNLSADLSFIERQAQKTVTSLAPGAYPRSGGQTGTWRTVGAGDWTSGFFPGELWLLYQATGSTHWLAEARSWTAPLASQATRTDTHDVGFIIGESFGNGYRLTGDPTYKSEILTAAASLATRYNPTVGAIRSWSFGSWQYPVIIDNMMTLGPLQWGATHGGNLAWGSDATKHAQTTIANLVRSNGSTYQLANFNPATGALIDTESVVGCSTSVCSSSTTWARGEAWGIYGFVQAYQATGNATFLTTAERLAGNFFSHLPSNYVPYWAFNVPVTSTTPRDTSAAAIAADALIMLDLSSHKTIYLTEAEDILGSLSSSYLAPANSEAVLADGSGGVPSNTEVDTALIYGDYFFTEALLRLENVLERKPGWTLYGGGSTPLFAAALDSAVTEPFGSAVPEPSTWAMMLIGFAGLGFFGYRRARAGRATLAA